MSDDLPCSVCGYTYDGEDRRCIEDLTFTDDNGIIYCYYCKDETK